MSKRNFYILLFVNFALFASVMLFYKRPLLLLCLSVIAALILLAQKRDDWKLFIIGFVIGVIVEIVYVDNGIWVYPDTIGVPYWMFLCWAIAFLTVYRVGTYLVAKRI